MCRRSSSIWSPVPGTTKNDMERDSAGARTAEGWKQLVKTTASIVVGEKLTVCSRGVKRWDEEAKEATRARRRAHARYNAE